ncbi:MAG TPA: LysR substrate-binding domain-containing protein [Ramlibacter sp.]
MARPVNFREIEAFRAVMQAGTTSAAAGLLKTTQPSVSRLLAQLQQATDLTLFELQKGRLRPTREAHELLAVVERHFLGLGRIEQAVASLRTSGAGVLRVGCTPALALGVLPAVVAGFTQRHSGVHVSLQTSSAAGLRESLLGGMYDLVLTTAPKGMRSAGDEILAHSAAVCVMHPSHPLARRAKVHVSDLAGQRVLTLNEGDDIQAQFQRLLKSHQVEVTAAVETTYSFSICRMAAAGAGIGVVNPYVASAFAHELRIVPLAPACPVQVILNLPAAAVPSMVATRFVAMLKAYFRDHRK